MITAELDDLAPLRALLHAAAPEPAEYLGRLAAARDGAAGADVLAQDLLQAEGAWLAVAAGAAARPATAALVALAERCADAAPASDVEALFELAEARGRRRARGDHAGAAAIARRITARVAAIVDLERARQEADERWAAHSAVDEQQDLPEQVALLAATAELLQQLATVHRDRGLRRRARRSRRAADDRELALALERRLSPRGVLWLENTSFVLLLVVLLVLLVENLWPVSPTTAALLLWVDGLACVFFVAEFLVKLALAPRRVSWFCRHALTDLLPAVPAVLLLLPTTPLPAGAEEGILLRLLRLFRITWAARYVQTLRPLLRVFRLVLLLVRGMDGLVHRFAALLDRNFVFFEPPLGSAAAADRRDLLFAALRRQQELWSLLPAAARGELLQERLQAVAAAAAALPGVFNARPATQLSARDIPVEEAAELLWSLQPGDVGRYLSAADLRALDRALGVLRTPPFRWLPFVRRFVVHPPAATPAERVAALAHRVAEQLQAWHGRAQFFADLHGIVTGPQILDRVASAMVKASQRPAVRLILFGGLFTLLDTLFTSDLLRRFVGLPLLLLGSVCLVLLMLGWWLKRIAGEASESFRLTSEAHFVSLLHLHKRRYEQGDLAFLAARVFDGQLPAARAVALLRGQLDSARAGVPTDLPDYDAAQEGTAMRVALLYLHFLDGALLHDSDIKTTEQVLANLSLENLRYAWIGVSRKQRKRLRLLRLDDGTVFRGPFLWFRFITESIAVETAKRITEYNRRCPPVAARARLGREQEQELRAWLHKRCDPKAGRTLERLPPPGAGTVYRTSEFTALDFLAAEPERDAYIGRTFGDDVLTALRADRRMMVREIFGMRPVHLRGREQRTFNAWRFYWSRLSHGRVLLVPLYALLRSCRGIAWGVGRIRQIVREVLAPHLARQQRQSGEAPFAAALRKIHRMKAPGLLEAIRMRLLVDPAYAGADEGWSQPPATDRGQLERDLQFLHLRQRARAEFLQQAQRNRQLVAQLHAGLGALPLLAAGAPAAARADGELAVTVAWMCDRDSVRTLSQAEHWRTEALARLAARRTPWTWRLRDALRDLIGEHPVDTFWRRGDETIGPGLRHQLRTAYARDPVTRATIDACNRLPDGVTPLAAAVQRLQEVFVEGANVRGEIAALRAVQSMAVLDVRNYRDLVFRLGGYAQDGEDPRSAVALP